MVSRTVSLEQGAYERLRAAKRPGESFSQTVNRLLKDSRPSFRVLAGVLNERESTQIRRAILDMRAREVPGEQDQFASITGGRRGHIARH
jgi:predicted CopG family antitoxin